MTDPIADYLTRIRNAYLAGRKVVEIPSSKMKLAITEILFDQGYILNTYAALVDQFFVQGSSDAAGMVAYKEQIEMALDQLSMLTPIEITLQLFSNNVFWGVFLAIPTALFAMKRVPPLNQ